MEQLFFAGKAYLKINSFVKTPLHEFMAVERSGLWAPDFTEYFGLFRQCTNFDRLLSICHNGYSVVILFIDSILSLFICKVVRNFYIFFA